MHRRTLASPASVAGVGVFTGAPAALTIEPAASGTGITLTRPGWPAPIPATIDNLSSAVAHPVFQTIPARCTAIGPVDAPVFTVEHALGALAGLGITDTALSLDAPEVPIDDGSARAFTEAILGAGVRELEGSVEPLIVTETLTVERDGARITIEPAETASYEYRLDFAGAAPIPAPIPAQTASWDGSSADAAGVFAREVAPARTFSFAREVEQLRALGLFASFTPADLLVIDDAGAPIDNAWRYDDEPARHKLLDLIGDLALVGRPIRARIVAERAGHALNHAAARAILDHTV